jgi:hypothetical protein
MSIISDFLESGLESLEDDLGSATFTFRGVVYPCILGTESRGSVLEMGGFAADVDLIILVRVSQLPEAVTVDTIGITVDSTLITSDNDTAPIRAGNTGVTSSGGTRVYRVTQKRLAPGGGHYEIGLVDSRQ